MTDTPKTAKPRKSVKEQITESLTGYKRPPEATRFKQGQSGNPRGRPRKAKPSSDANKGLTDSAYDLTLADELARTQTVTEKGKRKRMPTGALIIRQTNNTALKGSPTAQGTVLREMRALEERNAERARQAEAEDTKWEETLKTIKARQIVAWDRWLQTGERPDDIFPHPSDVDDYRKGSGRKWRWPFDEQDLPRAVHYRLMRDKVLLMCWQQERATETSKLLAGFYHFLAEQHNERLSIIWRIDIDQLCPEVMTIAMMSARQREREIDMIDEMQQLLCAAHPLDDGSTPKELLKFNQKLATHAGYPDMATLSAEMEGQRCKRMTKKLRAEAKERLDAMFVVDIEQERLRRRRLTENFAAKPNYAKGRAVLV